LRLEQQQKTVKQRQKGGMSIVENGSASHVYLKKRKKGEIKKGKTGNEKKRKATRRRVKQK